MRDKINPNPSGEVPASLTQLMARDGNNNNGKGASKGSRVKIFNRRMKDEQRSNNGLLQPMLSGQQRLLGCSEGDINKNMSLSSTSSPSLLVDGNNNNDNSEEAKEGEDEPVVNIPVDRRKSSVEPLQKHNLESQLLLINPVTENGVEEDFEDIDGGSSVEQEEEMVEGLVTQARENSSEESSLKGLPTTNKQFVSVCGSNC